MWAPAALREAAGAWGKWFWIDLGLGCDCRPEGRWDGQPQKGLESFLRTQAAILLPRSFALRPQPQDMNPVSDIFSSPRLVEKVYLECKVQPS